MSPSTSPGGSWVHVHVTPSGSKEGGEDAFAPRLPTLTSGLRPALRAPFTVGGVPGSVTLPTTVWSCTASAV